MISPNCYYTAAAVVGLESLCYDVLGGAFPPAAADVVHSPSVSLSPLAELVDPTTSVVILLYRKRQSY